MEEAPITLFISSLRAPTGKTRPDFLSIVRALEGVNRLFAASEFEKEGGRHGLALAQ